MKNAAVPLEFIGTSFDDLSEFPLEVKKEIGFALWTAQLGNKHSSAKPLKGFGSASVLEIVSDFRTDTFRAVYTVKLKGTIYVLHAFQKKSNQGNKTSPNDTKKIKARLGEATELHAEIENEQSQKQKKQR
jgi:phage-related protein